MAIVNRVFGKAQPATATASATGIPQRPDAARVAQAKQTAGERRQGTGISYDPDLIKNLKHDHTELVRIYKEIVAAKDRGDFEGVGGLLNSFKLALQTHLMVENVRFYAYVQQQYAMSAETSVFIGDVRKEMDGIAHAAVRFVNTYASCAFTPELKIRFVEELGAIGDLLVKRVTMEEERLYTLYQPA